MNEPTVAFIAADGPGLLLLVDLGVYDLTSLLKTVHLFTDRCHVHVQRQSEGRAEVRFQSKSSSTDLRQMVGEFTNALLDQTLRSVVARETEGVRNLILAHALSKTSLIASHLETDDPRDDPRRVGIPDDAKSPAP